MPTTSRRELKVLETYARSLLEAGKTEGRVFENLNDLESIARVSPEVLAVLATLVERGQLDLLRGVVDTYRAMTEEDEDVVGVTVTTAVPLDDDLRSKIIEQLEGDFGKSVCLIEQVDPSIVGGIVLEARGQRRDISVKTQLRAAREALSNVQTSHGQTGGETAHV